MNYQPYEYSLLLQELNHLGKEGYLCKDLSYISFFQKQNHPIYYWIDFHQVRGKNKVAKNDDLYAFYDIYQEQKFYPIYSKKNMHVFYGKQPFVPHHQINIHALDSQKKRHLLLMLLGIILFIAMIAYLFFISTIDTFISYGITITFFGLFLGDLFFILHQIKSYYCYQNIEKKPKLHQSHHYIRFLFSLLLIISICGGLVEDMFNMKIVTPHDHPLILLQDLNFDQESTLTYHQHTSFTLPKSYQSLEIIDEETILHTKEYQFTSKQQAHQYFQKLSQQPQIYYCDQVKAENHIIYGYLNQKMNTIIIQNENRVIMILSSFSFNEQQIQTIIQFYTKEL